MRFEPCWIFLIFCFCMSHEGGEGTGVHLSTLMNDLCFSCRDFELHSKRWEVHWNAWTCQPLLWLGGIYPR